MTSFFIVEAAQRLDVLLAGQGFTRSRAAAMIRSGYVRINEKVVGKPSFIPNIGDEVVICIPKVMETSVSAEDIPLDVLFEDEALAVVLKPCGMVVHPAAGNPTGTLVNALLHRLDSLSGIGGEKRPGIVHRLDKDTSGLMVIAKNNAAHLDLSAQLAQRTMEKRYYAVVAGEFREDTGVVDAPIARSTADRKKMAVRADGRPSRTEWRVARRWPDKTLLDIHLITGRTHQIRVHMAHIHHPVLGDVLYGVRGMPRAARLMLHAYALGFVHPITGKAMRFFAPPEASFGMPDHHTKNGPEDEPRTRIR